jgi:hypothetical protein
MESSIEVETLVSPVSYLMEGPAIAGQYIVCEIC